MNKIIKRMTGLIILFLCIFSQLFAGDFDFDLKNVYPKLVTPGTQSASGENNYVFFQFRNLGYEEFKLRIFDLEGRNVTEILTSNSYWKHRNSSSDPYDYYVRWDCRDLNNQIVLPGTYLYLVETSKRVFSGAITVAR